MHSAPPRSIFSQQPSSDCTTAPIAGGTRLTLRHVGIVAPEVANNARVGWQTSFGRLAEILGADRG
jgi:hypothetical protein